MSNTTTDGPDLLALKTEEFDKLPGLLLGLDGWIIRSVPVELRKQFLESYQKILRVVFHPDRYQDESVKRSRQGFLQAVSEAVEFMTRDDFNFDIASDSVPTKRNPYVVLQQSLKIRDGLIDSINKEVNDLRVINADYSKEINSLRLRNDTVMFEAEKLNHREVYFRGVIMKMINRFPVPCRSKGHQVTGCFIDTDRLIRDAIRYPSKLNKGKVPASLARRLEHYSTEDRYCNDTEWVTGPSKSNPNKKFTTYAEDFKSYSYADATIKFKGRVSLEGDYSIVAVTTIAHLCEYLREQRSAYNDRQKQRLAIGQPEEKENWFERAIRFLLHIPGDEAETGPGLDPELDPELEPELEPVGYYTKSAKLRSFLLSFYTPGSFLLLHPKTKGALNKELKLFLVETSNYSDAPSEALIEGHRSEIAYLLNQLHKKDDQLRRRSQLADQKFGTASEELKWHRRRSRFVQDWFKEHKKIMQGQVRKTYDYAAMRLAEARNLIRKLSKDKKNRAVQKAVVDYKARLAKLEATAPRPFQPHRFTIPRMPDDYQIPRFETPEQAKEKLKLEAEMEARRAAEQVEADRKIAEIAKLVAPIEPPTLEEQLATNIKLAAPESVKS